MIYLDNAATTMPYYEVTEEMARADRECFANPSSMHILGYAAEKEILDAEKKVKAFIGAKGGNVVFTSGGTEGNNLAFFGTLRNSLKRNPHIITTKIEHPSVLEPVKLLEETGAAVSFVGVNEKGLVDADEIAQKVSQNTKIVSVMYVNNETGAIQPISEISKKIKAKNKDVLFHVDCVQAAGNVKIEADKCGIDMLTISAHKIHGPKGVGAFYYSDRVKLVPHILGGHQQKNIRSGTQNTTGILGFKKAIEKTEENFLKKQETFCFLKNKIINYFDKNDIFTVNNAESLYSPHIVSISVKNVRAEVLLHALEAHGICISAGSACSTNKPAPSHVLMAQGFDRKKVEETIRVSLGAFNTEEEIDEFLKIIEKEGLALSKFTRI